MHQHVVQVAQVVVDAPYKCTKYMASNVHMFTVGFTKMMLFSLYKLIYYRLTRVLALSGILGKLHGSSVK